MRRIDRHRLGIRFAILGVVLALAVPASAVPASLRSEADLADLADAFMTSMGASDVKGAYRLAVQYWPVPPSELGALVDEGQERRREARRTLGLSLGYDLVSSEKSGERLYRITHLERFDKGVLVWRFVFYRAEGAWTLLSLSESDDPNVLFGR